MLSFSLHKASRVWEKNRAEIRSGLSRNFPRFCYASDVDRFTNDIPVFVYHTVNPVRFERQLQYLAKNGYKTLSADQLLDKMDEGAGDFSRSVALTFDDARGSFWAVAYPLLRKYGFSAILFVVPGLVPYEDDIYPTLVDVENGNASLTEVTAREQLQPLCTWKEIASMHQSGLVDIQSHSLTHSRINVSARVVDFFSPEFNTCFFENADIPVFQNKSPERPLHGLRLGYPIYESASRLSGRLRFVENREVGEQLVEYVSDEGGVEFFSRVNWRGKLHKKYDLLNHPHGLKGSFETTGQMKDAIRYEFSRSKEMLESKLFKKQTRHFCYPWFQGSVMSDDIARECGYRSAFYGMELISKQPQNSSSPKRIRRISEEYLQCLPGQGRDSIGRVWARKVMSFIGTFAR